MKFQLEPFNRNISDKDLLEDLNKVSQKINSNSLSFREYNDNGGRFTSGTIAARFGSWNAALLKAGLKIKLKHNPTEIELFRNLETVWISLGRQPRSRDMERPLSEFSQSSYFTKFGSFQRSLELFVEFINKDNDKQEMPMDDETIESIDIFKHKTKRNPSERLKVQVLMRDGNKCKLCGITLTGDNIHFDHIVPWSKGGETVIENLQILCATHNLAKGSI